MSLRVIKVGGNDLSDPEFVRGLAASIAAIRGQIVIVHGGGRAIAEMQRRLGIEPVMVEGLRVTDQASLEVAQMILSGHSNKLIVAELLRRGVDAIGLSGVDGGLLRCVRRQAGSVDLGLVGRITSVRAMLLTGFLEQGLTPVVSPISLGDDGFVYNVNADEAAAAVAAALSADVVDFVSNVPGVLDHNGAIISRLAPQIVETLIASDVITGGMIPKVRAALQALDQGVSGARIVDVEGLRTSGGTLFVRETGGVEAGSAPTGGK